MNIQLVVFDMAGTTVHDDNAVSQNFRAALADFGLAVDPASVNAVMGLPKPEAIRRLIEESVNGARLRDQIDPIHRNFVERMQRHYATSPSVREMEDASATFAALRRAGVKVALNTGFSRDIAQIVIDRLGWNGSPPAIDASVTSDEVARGRPHTDMIRYLMRILKVSDPARVAKVGDTPADLEEGTNAGCGLVIGVTNGSHLRDQLEPYPHTHLLASVADVPGLLLA